jgi:hypothetical protein
MENQKDRIKKNLIGFLNFTNRFGKEKNLNLYFSMLELTRKWRKKEFYLEFEKTSLFKKSSNLQRFVSERKKLDRFNEKQFKESIILPKVLRFNHWEENTYFDEIWDTLIQTNIVPLGCHNLSDRISISNPKKILSVRTKISFPHYGANKVIQNSLGEKITTVPNEGGGVKSVFDENGNCWFNHSINLIKYENEWKRMFPDETDLKPDWSDTNPKLYEAIGNGVLTDLELVNFQNLGIYHSFKYKLTDVFSFEDFSDEEISWVSDWLDWEYISLVFSEGNNQFEYHYFEDLDGYSQNYSDALNEIVEEKGKKFCSPLILQHFFKNMENHISGNIENKVALKRIFNSLESGEIPDSLMENFSKVKTEKIDKHISWVKKLTEGGVFTKPKIEIDGRNVKSNISDDKTIKKKMAYSMSFLEDRFNFSKNTISEPVILPVSLKAIQRKLGLD